jgi:hypothetical protein
VKLELRHRANYKNEPPQKNYPSEHFTEWRILRILEEIDKEGGAIINRRIFHLKVYNIQY